LKDHNADVPTEHVLDSAEEPAATLDDVTPLEGQQEETIPENDTKETPEEDVANDSVVEAPVTEERSLSKLIRLIYTATLDESSEVDIPPTEQTETLPEVAIEGAPSVEQPLEEETIQESANDNEEPVESVEHPLVIEEGKFPFLTALNV
jgi:hypothetical protein